jgi:hypothetical protein
MSSFCIPHWTHNLKPDWKHKKHSLRAFKSIMFCFLMWNWTVIWTLVPFTSDVTIFYGFLLGLKLITRWFRWSYRMLYLRVLNSDIFFGFWCTKYDSEATQHFSIVSHIMAYVSNSPQTSQFCVSQMVIKSVRWLVWNGSLVADTWSFEFLGGVLLKN